ncbi:MAG: nucleotidyltransferase domain-containing protein [Labilithrix sp.]|nr:nucleotidyltransferase domain-containing protein [Labilithrix sp.]MBX3224468.1 nucleotidyltransferase domain-containing protein [Labilithrix sp.]
MKRVLEEEEARREHLVVYLSGAHAYGFPSPDSDLDLKTIHIADTADLLGFDVPAATVDRAEIIDGVEIDYTSNELVHALAGILAGNGNFIERVLGRMTPYASSLLDELRPLVRRALSRRVHRHYAGFARSQLRFLEKEPTAKKLLYVLRTTLTGIHLLETGEVEPDLARLMDGYDVADAASLIERKRVGERVGLDPTLLDAWRPRVAALFGRLNAARATSPLPEDPPNEDEVRAFLLAVRRSRLR